MNNKSSALSTPLFQKVYDLYRLLHLYHDKIPKPKRYTIWQKCESATLDLLEALIATSHLSGEKRLGSLRLMSQKIDLLKVLTRLAKDTQTIDIKKYITIETLLQEIGKMTGGWIKFVSR